MALRNRIPREALQIDAGQIERILRGAKPAAMPIHQATRLDLVINLKIARALRLTIAQVVMVQATAMIEAAVVSLITLDPRQFQALVRAGDPRIEAP